MAFRESEKAAFEDILSVFVDANRPREEIRDEVDWGYRFEGQSFVLYEIRPDWRDTNETIESPFAKATYVRSRNCWKIYWQRADLSWDKYDPCEEAATLPEVLDVIREDAYHCFFG